jgi:hypothetical protein
VVKRPQQREAEGAQAREERRRRKSHDLQAQITEEMHRKDAHMRSKYSLFDHGDSMELSPQSRRSRSRSMLTTSGELGRRAGVSLTFEDGNGVLEVARHGGEAGGGGGQGQGGVGAGEQAQGSLPSKAAGGGGGAKKGHKTAKVGCTCSKSRCLKCYCVCFSKQVKVPPIIPHLPPHQPHIPHFLRPVV